MSETHAPGARRSNPIVRLGWKMSGVFALLLGTFLVAGLVLPGSWSAEATLDVQAPAAVLYPLIASPVRWDEWAEWPEMTFTYEGPAGGIGARRSWDESGVGSGTFTVTGTEAPTLVEYRVEVDGGALVTFGSFRLEPLGGATRVTWRESGDFGANPLMSWAARSMTRSHGAELERRLHALASVAEGSALP